LWEDSRRGDLNKRSTPLFGIVIALAVILCGLGSFVWYLVAAPSSQLLGKSLAHGNEQTPAIALTFDDGPGTNTPQILAALKEAGVRATFFLCGCNAERHPEIARQIAADGHEIGNHTFSHLRLLGRSPGRIAWEIDRAQKVIGQATGRQPNLFRPPYGLRWFGLFPILRQHKLVLVMWSLNARDWRSSAAQIIERVVRKTKPGSIVLLHDGMPPGETGDRSATAEALPAILHTLAGRFRFLTISEIQS
jgi:peptidoglycan-N-acetylglucosamine deacetylase